MTPLEIGSLTVDPPLMLAPMAGITDRPFRKICRRLGAPLCFTEMVSVNGLVRRGKKTEAMLPCREEEHPVGVQLFGSDPETLAEGARRAAPHADLIDINMGCPVRKVVSTGAGSALLRDTRLVAAIISRVRAATSLPLTIKFRSGWDDGGRNYREIGGIAAAEGCDAVIFHPRTRAQMFEGQARWEEIADLVTRLPIPVIASGDIFTPLDAVRVMKETGCSGVMIARGALGNPWIFDQVRAVDEGRPLHLPGSGEVGAVVREHYLLLKGESGEHAALREMRKHLGWYAKGVPGAAAFRRSVNQITTERELLDAVVSFFGGSE